ncbi:MAG TPA: hypothetical protein VGK09_05040 [Rhodocyclaceae bacterium]|jgi:hypothetical protein
MFDSPFDLCPVHREMVLLDQTVEECARDHSCQDYSQCPLGKCFVGTGDEARQLQKERDDPKR